MKIIYKLLSAALAIATIAGLSSCHDDQMLSGGQGVLLVSTHIKDNVVPVVKVNSRATAEELGDKCLLHIYNKKGLVRRYAKLSEIPAEGIKLVADHYQIKAWAGDSVSASFDHQYFKGSSEFDISGGQTTNINLDCTIANVAVALSYDDEIDDYMDEYRVTVGHKRGNLVYEGREERWGYFMMPSSDKDLSWKLEGKLKSGEDYSREGVINNAKPATLYTLNLNLPSNNDPVAGGFLTIEVDETPLDEFNNQVVIAIAPLISAQADGQNIDLTKPYMAETGKVGTVSMIVAASSALDDVILSSDDLGSLVNDDENEFNLMKQTDEYRRLLEDAGIFYSYEYDAEDDVSWLKINFESLFTDKLEAKEYRFDLNATDTNGKSTKKTLIINCEDAPVIPAEVDMNDVWATKATVSGQILKADATNPGVVYRAKTASRADGDWIQATDVKISGNTYTTTLTDLKPGTTYEYTVTADGYISSNIQTFTTEAAPQLPNSSFEDWFTDGKIARPQAQGASMFWDSGNTGAALLSKTVTDKSTQKYHSGTASACLTSQFVGLGAAGKFAAGNIFIGEYLKTLGMDGGVLGWGRNWSSRPTAVTAWVHYTPVNITHADTNPANAKKGDPDTGIIYVAILDENTETYDGKNYPVIVDTTTKKFFDKDSEHVLAYGEVILDKATEGDAMVQVRIPLTYKSNKKAGNIMLTAAASRYGDYFTGGNGSVLYLDDIQLEY